MSVDFPRWSSFLDVPNFQILFPNADCLSRWWPGPISITLFHLEVVTLNYKKKIFHLLDKESPSSCYLAVPTAKLSWWRITFVECLSTSHDGLDSCTDCPIPNWIVPLAAGHRTGASLAFQSCGFHFILSDSKLGLSRLLLQGLVHHSIISKLWLSLHHGRCYLLAHLRMRIVPLAAGQNRCITLPFQRSVFHFILILSK